MATKRPLATIFTYFETGDVPTQVQYEDAWFSMRHKDDAIAISEVTLLANALTGISTTKTNGQTITIPSKAHIGDVWLKSLSAGDVKVESGSGLENVVPLTTFTAGQIQHFKADFFNDTAGNLTLTVTSPGSVTIVYTQRIITI
jgi:hypothetical protein